MTPQEKFARRFQMTADCWIWKALAKLTEQTVRALRHGYNAGFPVSDMARIAGVSPKTARDAINGVTWSHVA